VTERDGLAGIQECGLWLECERSADGRRRGIQSWGGEEVIAVSISSQWLLSRSKAVFQA
jgi:hypothetical protein